MEIMIPEFAMTYAFLGQMLGQIIKVNILGQILKQASVPKDAQEILLPTIIQSYAQLIVPWELLLTTQHGDVLQLAQLIHFHLLFNQLKNAFTHALSLILEMKMEDFAV